MDSLYPSYMNKVFTCFLFFLSFWAVSQKNSFEVQYEDNDFIFLDDAYVSLLKETHAQLILRHKDCAFLETCEDTKTKNLGEVLFQKKANLLYKATYKKQPKYPRKALEKLIEGYVILAFDIEIDGSTSNHYVIEGKCIKERVYPYEDCTIFNSAALKAARTNRYDVDNTSRIIDVPHKYTFEIGGYYDSEKIYTNISERSLRRAKNFQSNQEWANLKKLAERVDDDYIKFYWLGIASENLNDHDFAVQNYIKSLSFQGDRRTMREVRNRTLSLLYRMNNFKAYSYVCDETYTFYDNYMCGMNMLQIGDSIRGVPYLLKAYRKNLEDNDSNQRIAEIIESQRNWIKEDLIKLQSSF
tara:strand:+ start:175 stop:1242 length:1068 start_codon:yes stop_codon:yes gene_type:complete